VSYLLKMVLGPVNMTHDDEYLAAPLCVSIGVEVVLSRWW
jgi:hypothetical protein